VRRARQTLHHQLRQAVSFRKTTQAFLGDASIDYVHAKVEHDALSDAIEQATNLQKLVRALRARLNEPQTNSGLA